MLSCTNRFKLFSLSIILRRTVVASRNGRIQTAANRRDKIGNKSTQPSGAAEMPYRKPTKTAAGKPGRARPCKSKQLPPCPQLRGPPSRSSSLSREEARGGERRKRRLEKQPRRLGYGGRVKACDPAGQGSPLLLLPHPREGKQRRPPNLHYSARGKTMQPSLSEDDAKKYKG